MRRRRVQTDSGGGRGDLVSPGARWATTIYTPLTPILAAVVLVVVQIASWPEAQALQPDRLAAPGTVSAEGTVPAEPGATLPPTQQGPDDDHHHAWDWDWGWGWWVVMPLMMLLIWGGLIAAVVWGIRQFGRGGRSPRPMDIARERLARGEITQEEFDRMRADLE